MGSSPKPPSGTPPGVPPLPKETSAQSPQAEDPAQEQPSRTEQGGPAALEAVTPAPNPHATTIQLGSQARPAASSPQPAQDAAKDPDRAGRFLIVDVYALDLGGKPNWPALAAASDGTNEYVGAILKATEGLAPIQLGNDSPHATSFDWFAAQWHALRAAGGDRYGVDWFRGAYHFLKFNQSGAKQADFYVKTVESVGGWDAGDIVPIVDVELGSVSNTNHDAVASVIIDCTSAFAERVKQTTGKRIMLYGRGAMRDKGIVSKMGCDVCWNPSYTAQMVTNGIVPPFSLADIALWQYSGDGDGVLAGYPLKVPGFGRTDLSVYVDGAAKPTLATLRSRLL
jgi:hypothetical protein